MKKALLTVFITLGIIVLLVVLSKRSSESNVASLEAMSSRDVALMCTSDMATAFHIHPSIRIFIDGTEVLVPKNLGILPGCMHSIHTHEDTPIIHVEAPVEKDFTLGDFFAVWDRPFSNTMLLDQAVGDGTLMVTVDGKPVDTLADTILRDKEAIVITLATK